MGGTPRHLYDPDAYEYLLASLEYGVNPLVSQRDITTEVCPQAPPSGDNRTHHLLPRQGYMTCRYCGKTRRELTDEVPRTARARRLRQAG